jgi:hypothetical protein
MKLAVVGALLGLGLFLPQAAGAVTLVQANFSGTLTSGSSAVKAPFNGAGSGIVQGMTFSGSFVYDSDLFSNVGLVLVPFATLSNPDSALQFTIGGLSFDLGDATTGSTGIAPKIQFNNGVFNGFNYVSDFTYSDGLDYRLRFNSKNFTVRRIDEATGFNVGTTINFQGNLSSTITQAPYVQPSPGVPEPSSWALMILGFGGAGAVLRQRRRKVANA